MSSTIDLHVEELSAMDAPSEWSDFVNGVMTGIGLVIIGIAVT